MKPTIYLPLADLRPTGLGRTSASSVAQFCGGRIAARRPWLETEGRQVGMNDQHNQTAGGPGQKRTS